MTDSDDVKPLGRYGPKVAAVLAAAKAVQKFATILVPTLVLVGGPITAWQLDRAAKRDAQARAHAEAQQHAQSAKQLAESGFQVTRHAVEQLQERVRVLEEAAKRIQAEAPSRRRRPFPAPPQVRVTASKPLPTSLDKAKDVIEQKTTPAPKEGLP